MAPSKHAKNSNTLLGHVSCSTSKVLFQQTLHSEKHLCTSVRCEDRITFSTHPCMNRRKAHTQAQMSLPVCTLCQGLGAPLCRCALGRALPGSWRRRSLSDRTPAQAPSVTNIEIGSNDSTAHSNARFCRANVDSSKAICPVGTEAP